MAAPQGIPSRAAAEEGARLAAANAGRLLEASRLIAERGNFGTATSLAILAGEESIKALALVAYSEGLSIPTSRQLGLLLRFHESRHMAAAMLVGGGEMLLSMFASLFAAFSRSGTGSAKERTKAELSRAAWWSDANDLKNRGLYIDYERAKWRTPGSTTETTFTRAYQEAETLYKLVEEMP